MKRKFLDLGAGALVACGSLVATGAALAADPIKIGVIAEAQAVAGSSIGPAAQLAAEEINAKGGIDGRKIEIIVYDDHSSAAEAVRAFHKAGQAAGGVDEGAPGSREQGPPGNYVAYLRDPYGNKIVAVTYAPE